MNTNKLLSIIIPHFNSPDSLERLLKSIGSLKEVETIIVDDKSTKDLEKYNNCKNKYESENVIFLNNLSKNKGAGTARNIGLSKASGKWVLFADSDDYFLDNWYKTVNKYFESDFDIIFFTPTCTNINEKNNRASYYILKCKDFINNKENSDFYLRFAFSPPWSKLIKRDLILSNNIQFDEVLYSNDVCFSTKIGYYAEKITAVSDTIYCVTTDNDKSLTKIMSEKAFFIRCQSCCNQYKFLKEKFKRDIFIFEPYQRIRFAMKHYKLNIILKTFKLFLNAGIPFLFLTPFNKYYLKNLCNNYLGIIKRFY